MVDQSPKKLNMKAYEKKAFRQCRLPCNCNYDQAFSSDETAFNEMQRFGHILGFVQDAVLVMLPG